MAGPSPPIFRIGSFLDPRCSARTGRHRISTFLLCIMEVTARTNKKKATIFTSQSSVLILQALLPTLVNSEEKIAHLTGMSHTPRLLQSAFNELESSADQVHRSAPSC